MYLRLFFFNFKVSKLVALLKHIISLSRFLRVQQQMSLTSTFKQQKTDLVKDGFNPSTVREPLYYLDRSTDEYKPLADEIYQEIINGQLAM